MKSFPVILFVSCGIFFSLSCKKDTTETFSDTPSITLDGVSPQQVKAYQDSLVFTVSYTDGNGDLGENDPDVSNLFLTDNRINVTHAFRIPQLAPDGADIPIEGTLSVVLKGIILTDTTQAQETVNFSVYVKDRAGNSSNTVSSGNVTVVK